jgi:hypothetical protein
LDIRLKGMFKHREADDMTLRVSDDNHIVKCNRCRKVMIHEEFSSHICTPVPTGEAKTIEVDYYIETKDEQSRTIIVAKGMDGVMYTLVERGKKESDKIPYTLPTESQQRKETPDKDNNTIIPNRKY